MLGHFLDDCNRIVAKYALKKFKPPQIYSVFDNHSIFKILVKTWCISKYHKEYILRNWAQSEHKLRSCSPLKFEFNPLGSLQVFFKNAIKVHMYVNIIRNSSWKFELNPSVVLGFMAEKKNVLTYSLVTRCSSILFLEFVSLLAWRTELWIYLTHMSLKWGALGLGGLEG